MRILALEPYCGGSHQAFLDGWRAHSRHAWTTLTLPAFRWKWRMRHAAITFAHELGPRIAAGETWDALFVSDMLDLAGFRGLAPTTVARLPAVAYFHENQLTYPVRFEKERDYHFGLTNMTTGLAAAAVWFNSRYHLDSFLEALEGVLRKMTDHQPFHALEAIKRKAAVHPPGIGTPPPRTARRRGPLHILWAARWEHDKDPETFFAALESLAAKKVSFRLSVIGEQFREAPPIFAEAAQQFAPYIEHWGYQDSREDYLAVLAQADVVVSTALHEFFGIGVVEAVGAGAYPLLPRRLAYPEIFDARRNPHFFHDGTPEDLAGRLCDLAAKLDAGGLWTDLPIQGRQLVEPFLWTRLAPRMDAAVEALARDAAGAHTPP